jgi:hypothetical protein
MRITNATCVSLLATVVVSLAGCITPPDLSDMDLDCKVDSAKPKPHVITYGVSNKKTTLQVREKVEVKQKTALVFKLKPKGSNPDGDSYANIDVTIVGKKETDKVWLKQKTRQGADNLIAFCAPGVEKDTPYEYEVHVDGLGMLDPRVDVKQ